MPPEGPVIATIVEGAGEVKALPTLLRRIAVDTGTYDLSVPSPWRLRRDRFSRDLGAAAAAAAARVSGAGGLLVVLDADDDCPVELATHLAGIARERVSHCPVEVAVASREFEAWFLASAPALLAHRDVVAQLTVPDPDAPRGAKEKLEEAMSRKYSPTLHQPAFAALMDMETAASCSRSFRHFREAVIRLLAWVGPSSSEEPPTIVG
ncbi:UNVERIFIED_ORG: DUF4276 family protein [Bacillus sp. AZ43]